MFARIQRRLSSEEGFTLIELLVVIIILGILIAIAVPAYLSLTSKANGAAASSNVRSAIPAAESFYETGGTYKGLSCTGAACTTGTLAQQAPGVKVADVTVSNDGAAYCIDATSGSTNAYYIGGDQTWNGTSGSGFHSLVAASAGPPVVAGAQIATITSGTGTTGSADLCADTSVGAKDAS